MVLLSLPSLDVVRNLNNDDTDDDNITTITDTDTFTARYSPKRFDLPRLHPNPHTNGGFDPQESGGGGEGEAVKTVDVGGGEKQTSFIVSKKNGSVISQALLAFSLPRNTERILGVRDVRDSVTCLHGIRVLSMVWLIVGNSVLYMATYFENALGAAEVLETMLGQVVIHSTLAVDSFLLISGCLTAVVFLREVGEEAGVRVKNVVTYFVHRYVRLTPAYAVTIMALTCLLPYMSDGPSWTQDTRDYYLPCQTRWWTNLLYVNNFHPSLQEQCMPWGWYLAVDLQFHWLVAPFIIIPLALGFKVLPFLLIGGLVVMQGVLTYYFDIDINGDYLRNRQDYWWEVFEKPYTRVAPFVLGLGVGYLLTRVKGRLNIHKIAVCAGWLVSVLVIVACVLVKYGDNHVMLEQPFNWPLAARAWHETMYRILFSLALCWVVFMCATGNGGFINSILSWKVWVPVSHLVFCMYLLHPAVILADMWQTRVPPYFTVSYLLQRACGYVTISAILAYCLSVTVETPISVLGNIVLNKPRPRRSRSASFSTAL
ncbi:nose resistant to fluoxetine protein 6-like [Babylonia areolata]|uniref:nose resistant to fluoxetine protein 6-like n=1 Tax=Babylonia areolata TaxID=304850 RepID=UPI003FCF127D